MQMYALCSFPPGFPRTVDDESEQCANSKAAYVRRIVDAGACDPVIHGEKREQKELAGA